MPGRADVDDEEVGDRHEGADEHHGERRPGRTGGGGRWCRTLAASLGGLPGDVAAARGRRPCSKTKRYVHPREGLVSARV
ncbi:MAG: hypothetical protein JWM18_2007 [Chloroflexi bacterium]|nr:hypothetical protein [Chloroflexota bacterium]